MNKKTKHLCHRDRCANMHRKIQRKFDFLAKLMEYFVHGRLICSQKTQSLCQVLFKTVIPYNQFNTQGVEKFFDQEFALEALETLVSYVSLNRSRCIFSTIAEAKYHHVGIFI